MLQTIASRIFPHSSSFSLSIIVPDDLEYGIFPGVEGLFHLLRTNGPTLKRGCGGEKVGEMPAHLLTSGLWEEVGTKWKLLLL